MLAVPFLKYGAYGMYFEVYQQAGQSLLGGQWRWRLKAANHQIIAQGESYHNQQDCLAAIGLVMDTNSTTPVRQG